MCVLICTMDAQRVASELIRALRGDRSQVALSRRLGFRTNVVYAWESGRRAPAASMLFRVAERVGIDVREALSRFYGAAPPWLDVLAIPSPALVAQVLRDQRGTTPIREVALRIGTNRFTVARWLSGQTEPRLPDFLRALEGTSLRLVDFVAALVDPQSMPSLAAAWRQREAQRTLAIEEPWAPAVLRGIEIGLRTEPELAQALGVPPPVVARSLQALRQSGQVARRRGQWQIREVVALDTRRSPETARALKSFWAGVGTERLSAGAEGAWAYNVFAVSSAQLERIRALQTAYFQALRSLIAEHEPADTVALVNLQVVELGSAR